MEPLDRAFARQCSRSEQLANKPLLQQMLGQSLDLLDLLESLKQPPRVPSSGRILLVVADPEGKEPLLVTEVPEVPAVGDTISFNGRKGPYADCIKKRHWVFDTAGKLRHVGVDLGHGSLK